MKQAIDPSFGILPDEEGAIPWRPSAAASAIVPRRRRTHSQHGTSSSGSSTSLSSRCLPVMEREVERNELTLEALARAPQGGLGDSIGRLSLPHLLVGGEAATMMPGIVGGF